MRFAALAGVAVASGLFGGVVTWYLLSKPTAGPGGGGGVKHEAYIDLFVYPVGKDPATGEVVCGVATLPFHAYVGEKAELTWQVRPESGPCADDVQDFEIAFQQADDIDPQRPLPTGSTIAKHQKGSKLKRLFDPDPSHARQNTRKYNVSVSLKSGKVVREDPEAEIWK